MMGTITMKTLLCAGALALLSTAAFAQDYDHDRYRDHDHFGPGRVIGHTLRAIEGREVYGGECRTIISRHRNFDGDVVVTRRRVCD